jgi:hypothetical protein
LVVNNVGCSVGVAVGAFDGRSEGIAVGSSVGTGVGVVVGPSVGRLVGVVVGGSVGTDVGVCVGLLVGLTVGSSVGRTVTASAAAVLAKCDSVGARVGVRVGISDGCSELNALAPVGPSVGETDCVADRASVGDAAAPASRDAASTRAGCTEARSALLSGRADGIWDGCADGAVVMPYVSSPPETYVVQRRAVYVGMNLVHSRQWALL